VFKPWSRTEAGEIVAVPPDPNPNRNLFHMASRLGFALAYLRPVMGELDGVRIYPEPGGLLGWGSDGGGGDYYWDTSSGDPDTWTVAISGRPIYDPPVQHDRRPLIGYLEALANGEVMAAALGAWPRPGARIERVTEP
jgi:hypothetical protein